jgi:hypothetical protein
MPDKDLEILIKTEAELSGAKAAEEQLERDISQARALNAVYEELEARLKRVREAMAGLPQVAAAGNAPDAKTGDAQSENSNGAPEEHPTQESAGAGARIQSVPGGPFDASGGQAVETHAQAIQSSAEKVRAALDQNGRMTVSLFNRMAELIGQQNRKLGELDRRVSNLGGQIDNLKNQH